MGRLSVDFYQQNDVVSLAKQLLGKTLFCKEPDQTLLSAKIVETEAYNGEFDKACHAYRHRYTPRTQVMYANGGILYVYLTYGIHYMLNIVTNIEGLADVILIRAIEPLSGAEIMLSRRPNIKDTSDTKLTAGPGALAQSLNITKADNGIDIVNGDRFWIEEAPLICESEIIASPRVGIGSAEEHRFLPWRFRIKNNKWTSKAK